jgi:hypothetical protein
VRRRDPLLDDLTRRLVRRHLFRTDLQTALHRVWNDMENVTVTEFRAFANNLAARFRDEGLDVAAARLEVHLPDNADRNAIMVRKDAIRDELMRVLIWDQYE